ncbi:hypothetical protein GUITHDRAFT_143856 [Guillardia theta CCMP2712]|uniref:Uncharacterized protein n=1 Tax=Guillardia theta (strain CCMP2712) TaxID=905079 RepID=L1IS12_GUITC|nr:hypothetical protein GUITHDRAFT_143856 [Guillardia theta CCMP2712]EKX39061.1 hypothetical protein GUITHDRAFT_143856 [Guillardia theta CCMP2712]|eukprot:XP_005826041.1 hypothetical protein GUITHDRAFT_143856 [Guillardia theta CCMP2712]
MGSKRRAESGEEEDEDEDEDEEEEEKKKKKIRVNERHWETRREGGVGAIAAAGISGFIFLDMYYLVRLLVTFALLSNVCSVDIDPDDLHSEPIEEDVVQSRFGIELDRHVDPSASLFIHSQLLKSPSCSYEDRTCLSSALKEMSQHSDALEQCYEHLEDSRNSLKTMEKTMNDHDDFFASKRSNLNAQVMNLRAQNEKLVYEVSTLQKEVDDLEMMVNSIDTKVSLQSLL